MNNSHSHRILLTWELGHDLGHIARLRPLALELKRRGHAVTIAAGQLQKLAALPASLDVIPAPVMSSTEVKDKIREPATFADVLYNIGGSHEDSLTGVVRAWRGIFDLVQPDVVVQDFSPFALLALQGYRARSMLLGTGFACPPDTGALPDIRAWQNHYPERLRITEQLVLDALNHQLTRQEQSTLAGIGELFTRVNVNCLATFPELDHYPERTDDQPAVVEYVGVWSDLGGDQPQWPEGEGPRVFAYLKPFRALNRLLDHLGKSGYPCLVYLANEAKTNRKHPKNLQIVDSPLDMASITRECNVSILHAGHGSTAAMLLAGKPILQLPFNVEQFHTARNTERLGAGAMAMIDNPEEITREFDQVIVSEAMRGAAGDFADRHRDFNQAVALSKVVDQIEALAART